MRFITLLRLMRKQLLLLSTLLGFLAFASVLYSMLGREAFAQKTTPAKVLVSKTASSAPSINKVKATTPAAAANSASLSSLAWGFGGKTQLGWEIYVPLISHTIGTEAEHFSDEFAAVLSGWQSKKGLPATGEMCDATMRSFVSHWQSQRLGRSTTPTSDALVSAPIIDFWDSGRDPNMLQLERETYAAYKRMLTAAAKDLGDELKFTKNGELAAGEKFLRIVSAYRSPAYQAALRKREPNAGRAALAKNSPHFTGQALDLYVGGEPVTTKDPNRLIQVQTPAYKWLVKNASRFGFYPYFYEPWHWEYVPGK